MFGISSECTLAVERKTRTNITNLGMEAALLAGGYKANLKMPMVRLGTNKDLHTREYQSNLGSFSLALFYYHV